MILLLIIQLTYHTYIYIVIILQLTYHSYIYIVIIIQLTYHSYIYKRFFFGLGIQYTQHVYVFGSALLGFRCG